MPDATSTAAATAQNVLRDLAAIRATNPVVLSITNYVVTNTTANALLAIGASPIMSHAVEEMAELLAFSGALVVNLGTVAPEYLAAMAPAWAAADKAVVPVVLDPVGAGASRLRTVTPLALLDSHKAFIIRGNASEIMALAGASGATTVASTSASTSAPKGVDSTALSEEAADFASALARRHNCAVVVSGEVDIVCAGQTQARVLGGSALMPRVTGLGCTATAICGAFAAVNPDPFEAALHACVAMKVAGEMAADKASGPGTLQLYLYDALYVMDEKDVRQRIRVER
ncbi:MAG: hydroxyethylthiazole kinase [Desulfovibrionales bacterium GWA2_65_9]|nr:MAG: hydroxyethylthiazole kinase [Desulfovibrionales bacterium GWA2_65_9]